MKLAGLLVLIGALAIVYAYFYALWDVLAHQPTMPAISRILWFVALLAFPVIGTVWYLRFGPGEAHWPPWDAES